MSKVAFAAVILAAMSCSVITARAAIAHHDGTVKGKIILFGIENPDDSMTSVVKALARDASIQTVSHIERSVSSARVSPDGNRIAYVAEQDGVTAMRLLSVDGGQKSLVLVTQKDAWIGGWSPDGTNIILGYGNRGTRTNSIVTIASGAVRPIELPKTEVVWDWSPDGKELLTISEPPDDEPRQIQRVAVDGSGLTCLTDRTTDNILPRFSPDGHKVVFSSSRTRRAQIYVMDRDGGNVQQVTSFQDRSTFWACWSPDGKEICCSSFKTGPVDDEGSYSISDPHLVLMNADGTDLKNFLPPESSIGWYIDWR